MQVAAIQFKATLRNPDASLARLWPLLRDAAQGSDLVVLPELALTGYLFDSPEDVRPFADRPQGRTLAAIGPVAREAGSWIVCGFVEDAGPALYNSALVVDPGGALAFTYRKTLLFEADHAWAHPGDSGYATFATRGGTFGVGICMDLNDDRFIDWVHAAAPRAVAFPTNWLDEGSDVRPYWAWRIRGSPSALVAANSYGPERSIAFSGRSTILKGHDILDEAPPAGDRVIRARI